MIAAVRWWTALTLAVAVFLLPPAKAADAPVYFLAIGSSRYLPPASKSDHGFADLSGARNGALALADRLSEGGAKFGISLTSPEGTVVGKADIDKAVDAILSRISHDRKTTSQPFLLVYIAAHGVSEGFGWNLFSVPGDLTYRGAPEALNIEGLLQTAIHAATLVDRLNKAKVHYLFLIDTCYEGKASRFDSPVLTPAAQSSIAGIAEGLRFMNEFHGENPVVFSTAPGTTVPVAPDPDDPNHNSMGPLARRLILHFRDLAAHNRVPDVSSVVAALTAMSGDHATRPGITRAKPAAWWSLPLSRANATAGKVEERVGTASVAQLCCQPKEEKASPLAEVPMRGSIRLTGSAGDSILGNGTLLLVHGITSDQTDPKILSLRVPDAGGDWSFDFAAPKAISTGRYAQATRYPFQDAGKNGLAVSGHGTSCNELQGGFEVTTLAAGQRRLSLSFRQRCVGDKGELIGQIDLER